jgi:hypothetical protein
VQGEGKLGVYTSKDGETWASLEIVAAHVLALRHAGPAKAAAAPAQKPAARVADVNDYDDVPF